MVGQLWPKVTAPTMQQLAQNDDSFDIGANFKRGIGEQIDQYDEEQCQQQLQYEVDSEVAGYGSDQYGVQAPDVYIGNNGLQHVPGLGWSVGSGWSRTTGYSKYLYRFGDK